MRPTDFCHPKDVPFTRISRVPELLSQLSLRARPADSKLRVADSRDRTFHDVRDRFGGSTVRAKLMLRLAKG